MVMADKKIAINQARWETIWEDDKRKAAMEERRLMLEDKKAMMELIADENRTMMMDPRIMDAFTSEWWDMKREEETSASSCPWSRWRCQWRWWCRCRCRWWCRWW
jgi:hypothetical protein